MNTQQNTDEVALPPGNGSEIPFPVYSQKPEVAALELINGAYDIIELWKAETPAQIEWKRAWMAKAIELGAHPSW